jgi:hypothetical protein
MAHYLVWAIGWLGNRPIPAKSRAASPPPPTKSTGIATNRAEKKSFGLVETESEKSKRNGGFGGRREANANRLTTQRPRKKQAVQSAATHLVGTRPGDALCCGLAAAIAAVLAALGFLVRTGREGKP